jgi:putative tryptophan/tyrosine transport system substrate-binding protein
MLLLGGAMTAPRGLCAQQKAMPVVGYLDLGTPDTGASLAPAFRQGLSETGYVEGQNVAIEYRWAEGDYDRFPALASDLVSRKVGVIAALGGIWAALAAKNATSTIPIVFGMGGDPVGLGLVASLARPGGNLTGDSDLTRELGPKRLELLCELVPQAGVIGLLVDSMAPLTESTITVLQEAATAKRVQLQILKVSSESEINTAFATLVQLHAGAGILVAMALFGSRRDQIVALAARYAVPVIHSYRGFPAAGGLISYGPSLAAVARRVGNYAGKILSGVKPADLPVEQPTTFELVVNLKTAKALGLTIPPSILARADEVIE